MSSPGQRRGLKLAGVLLGLGLLLFVAVRAGRSGDDLEDSLAAGLAETKSQRSRERDPDLEAERAATKRAREALHQDPRLKEIWEEGSYEHALMRRQLKPFDAVELRRLAKEQHPDLLEMTRLLLRAGAEKHPGFQDLLARPELREEAALDMALCAYDYSVNGNREALERIVAWHRAAGGTQDGNWGDPASWALGYVDEWDLAKQGLESHLMSGDGSGGDERYAFWLNRRYFFPANRDFPDDYDRFVEDLTREQEKNRGE